MKRIITDPAELGDVLGVWAHPDDEMFAMSGILATAAANGTQVALVTATRGEGGSWDQERWPTATLGAVRTKELEDCLRVLGVSRHTWLDYPDGGLDSIHDATAVSRIAAVMRDVAPESVFTFGPDGMTGHPDHRTISAWTSAAFNLAAPTGARLYHFVQVPETYAAIADRARQFNVFFNIAEEDIPVVAHDRLAVDYVLPAPVLELKRQALLAHRSQVEGMLKVFGEDLLRHGLNVEAAVLGQTKD